MLNAIIIYCALIGNVCDPSRTITKILPEDFKMPVACFIAAQRYAASDTTIPEGYTVKLKCVRNQSLPDEKDIG